MRGLIWFLAGAIALAAAVCAGGLFFLRMRAHGFSAQSRPSLIERWVARRTRAMAWPAGKRTRKSCAGFAGGPHGGTGALG